MIPKSPEAIYATFIVWLTQPPCQDHPIHETHIIVMLTSHTEVLPKRICDDQQGECQEDAAGDELGGVIDREEAEIFALAIV